MKRKSKTRSLTKTRTLIASVSSLSALLVTSCGDGSTADPRAVESLDFPFRSFWNGHDHNDITEKGLPMLSDSLADWIGDENEDMDTPLTDRQKTNENHLDNCSFATSFDRMRERYTTLLADLNPDAFNHSSSVVQFGRILHATQDLVSHSNWLEQGQTSVINGDGFLPPPVGPGSMLGDLVVLQNGIPSDWVVSRRGPSGIAARQVLVSDGVTVRNGLITGEYKSNFGGSLCPAGAAIPHGDLTSQGAVETYLAKDDPDSFMHKEAIALAIRQTTEEFCRLDRMVLLRYGEPGAATFRNHWGIDAAKRLQACPNNEGIVTSVWASVL